MKPLTAEQQALAAAHAYVANWAAGCYRRSPLDRDERLSAAGLGVTMAAMTWRPGSGPFESYAIRCALRRIHRDVRTILRRPTVRLEYPRSLAGRDDHVAEADRRDLAAALMRQIDHLSPRQREAITRYVSGLRWIEVAVAMRSNRLAVERLRCRAVATLRRLMADE